MQKDWQDAQGNAPDPYERWSDANLEGLRDTHADPRLRLSASDDLSRRAVERALLLLGMQDAPDAVLQAHRDQHQNRDVRALAAEQLSRRAEQRFQAVVPKSGKVEAEEAAGLIRDTIQAELDAAEANAVEEYGSVIDRTIQSRRYRDQLTAFKRKTARSFVEDFCQRAEQDLPGYRAAYDTLKRYVLGEITASEMEVKINAHLDLYPVRYQVSTKPWRGKDNWSLDHGGAMTGWHALAFMIPEHVSLWRFRVCPQCQDLFYDDSPAGNKRSCGKKACIRLRKTLAKRHERSKTP